MDRITCPAWWRTIISYYHPGITDIPGNGRFRARITDCGVDAVVVREGLDLISGPNYLPSVIKALAEGNVAGRRQRESLVYVVCRSACAGPRQPQRDSDA